MTTNLSLAPLLGSSIFYHTDVARSSDSYVYESVLVSYNEPDNVTCAGCGWRVGGFTHPTRNWPYLWQNTFGQRRVGQRNGEATLVIECPRERRQQLRQRQRRGDTPSTP